MLFLLLNLKFDDVVKQRYFTDVPNRMYHKFRKTQGVRHLNSINRLSLWFILYQQHFHFAQPSYLSTTHLKPICSVPESGDVFILAATRYPLQYDSLHKKEPPLITRLAISGSSGS